MEISYTEGEIRSIKNYVEKDLYPTVNFEILGAINEMVGDKLVVDCEMAETIEDILRGNKPMRILYIATDKLPKNCMECVNETCNLPLKKGNCSQLQKKYLTKRHVDCLLKVVTE